MSRALAAAQAFFSLRGRIGRRDLWLRLALLGALLAAADGLGDAARLGAAAIVLASAFTLLVRRAHDRGHSAWWLAWALVPLLGPVLLAIDLLVRKGTSGENQHGDDPTEHRLDHLRVEDRVLPGEKPGTRVEEVTRLHRVEVFAVASPRSVDEVRQALARTAGPVSIGGGRFSMGGQIASEGSLHLDMRAMNRVLELSLEKRTIRVEPGVRWCDVQKVVDPHGLAVKIMQSYANFTVGGSLSVNVHGRYVGLGPLVLSVRSVDVVFADGTLVRASRTERPEVFFGVVGGYGALGVIVAAELELAENGRVEEVSAKLPRGAYAEHFRSQVRDDPRAVLHNADLYGPHHRSLRSVTWVDTKRPPTTSSGSCRRGRRTSSPATCRGRSPSCPSRGSGANT